MNDNGNIKNNNCYNMDVLYTFEKVIHRDLVLDKRKQSNKGERLGAFISLPGFGKVRM
jgi:hypothetical protein